MRIEAACAATAWGAVNIAESFRDKSFVVVDPDARIRRAEDLMAFMLDAVWSFPDHAQRHQCEDRRGQDHRGREPQQHRFRSRDICRWGLGLRLDIDEKSRWTVHERGDRSHSAQAGCGTLRTECRVVPWRLSGELELVAIVAIDSSVRGSTQVTAIASRTVGQIGFGHISAQRTLLKGMGAPE